MTGFLLELSWWIWLKQEELKVTLTIIFVLSPSGFPTWNIQPSKSRDKINHLFVSQINFILNDKNTDFEVTEIDSEWRIKFMHIIQKPKTANTKLSKRKKLH